MPGVDDATFFDWAAREYSSTTLAEQMASPKGVQLGEVNEFAGTPFFRQLGAGFRQENLFLTTLAPLFRSQPVYTPEKGFSPNAQLGQYAQYVKEFPELLEASSFTEMAAIKNRIDSELMDRRKLSDMGFLRSLAVYLPAGLLSPENFIPIGAAVRGAGLVGEALVKAGARAALKATAKRAALVGVESATAAAIAELAIQQGPKVFEQIPKQGFRTTEESIVNVVGAGVLGTMLGTVAGGFGAGKSTLMKKVLGEETLTEVLSKTEAALKKDLGDPNSKVGLRVDEAMAKLKQEGDRTLLFNSSKGLTQTEDPAKGILNYWLKEENPNLAKLFALDNMLGRFVMKSLLYGPAGRLARSPVQEGRLFGGILTRHFLTTENFTGPSIESMTRLAEIGLYRMRETMDLHWKENADLFKQLGVTEKEFFDMGGYAAERGDRVSGKATRRGGVDVDPFEKIRGNEKAVATVEALAKQNREFFEVFKTTAERVGGMSPSLRRRSAAMNLLSMLEDTYFPRVVQHDVAQLRRAEFVQSITDGLLARRDELLPEFRDELAELRAQMEVTDDAIALKDLERDVKELELWIERLNDPDEFRNIARSIVSNYLDPRTDAGSTRPQSSLRSRVLEIDPRFLEEFLVKDVRAVQSRMIRSVMPDLLLADQWNRHLGADPALLAKTGEDLGSIIQRIEKAREFGVDRESAAEIVRDLEDLSDDAQALVLGNMTRLLENLQDAGVVGKGNEDPITATMGRIRRAVDLRKRERRVQAVLVEERADLDAQIGGYQDQEAGLMPQLEAELERAKGLRVPVKTFTDPSGLKMAQVEVPMRNTFKSKQPGSTVTMIFDTGASTTVITEQTAKDLAAKPIMGPGKKRLVTNIHGVGAGSVPTYRARISGLDIGGIRVRDVEVLVGGRHNLLGMELINDAFHTKIVGDELFLLPREGRAKDISAKRSAAARQMLEQLSEWRAAMKELRAQRDVVTKNLQASRAQYKAVTAGLDTLAKRIGDQVGRAEAIRAPSEDVLRFRRNQYTLSEITDPRELQTRIETLGRLVEGKVADARRRVFSMNVDTEHLGAAVQRGYQRSLLSKELRPGKRNQLLKRMKDDIEDLRTEVERLRNRHGIGNGDQLFSVTGKRLRDFNYVTKMGSVLISSWPDAAMAISTAGFMPYMKAVARFFKHEIFTKKNHEYLADWIHGAERYMEIARHQRLLGIDDDVAAAVGSKFDDRLDWLTRKFTKATMLDRWNAMHKFIAAQAIESRVVKTILSDNPKKADVEMLRFFGIADSDHSKLRAQMKKFSQDDGYGWVSNSRNWTDRDLTLRYEAAILKGVEDTIISPSVGDLPRFATSSPLGRMLLQFRSFALSTSNRFLIPGIQRTIGLGDPMPALAFAVQTMLGALVYAAHEQLNGRDPLRTEYDEEGKKIDPFRRWAFEAVDRGGGLGVMTEATSSLMKATGLGGHTPSRFVSRNELDAWLGPSFGTAKDIIDVGTSIFRDDYNSSDASRLRRLIPFQNLWQLRIMLDIGPNLPNAGGRKYFDDFLKIEHRIGGFEPWEVRR